MLIVFHSWYLIRSSSLSNSLFLHWLRHTRYYLLDPRPCYYSFCCALWFSNPHSFMVVQGPELRCLWSDGNYGCLVSASLWDLIIPLYWQTLLSSSFTFWYIPFARLLINVHTIACSSLTNIMSKIPLIRSVKFSGSVLIYILYILKPLPLFIVLPFCP